MATPTLERGARFGPYEVFAYLARGGMAELYLARTRGAGGFEKVVVLKRILPEFADNPEFVAMFLAEARLAATLDHPNLVAVRDVGDDGEAPYFTMDYIHGRSVLELASAHWEADQSSIPADIAIALVIGAAMGLNHAHGRHDYRGNDLHIVHRDVTPSNIMLTYEGQVKVIDFGVAKSVALTHKTDAGQRKGKLSYMSPEQCAGTGLDGRSDIFALGIVLYELLTMSRLFLAEEGLATLERIIAGDIPPLRERNPDISEDLEAVVMKALATDREDRYQDGRKFAAALRRYAAANKLDVSAGRIESHMAKMFARPPFPWLVNANLLPEPTEPAIDHASREGDVRAPTTRELDDPAPLEREPAAVAIPIAPPQRRRLAIGVGAVAALGGVLAVATLGRSEPAPSDATMPALPAPESEPQAPREAVLPDVDEPDPSDPVEPPEPETQTETDADADVEPGSDATEGESETDTGSSETNVAPTKKRRPKKRRRKKKTVDPDALFPD